ncbi:hypothetical protein MTBBW1_830047 [Desulfamplus magnetovallimortis]|uniref:Uncharacterized protein n=1 Tax=Desulfamplus magnetovallimortis TaxID=1246637 RepID=A0A1W1HKN3_9BACT|nr:hypothetical protein [Desulfamplus magnetovallimortis]SLM32975.1 hypothetical protein MTBBW1_830047 [Desulfamplus magnetovallimortis]
MNDLKVTIGFSPQNISKTNQAETIQKNLTELLNYRPFVYDLHFPHYNPQICASGRPVNSAMSLDDARNLTFHMISWNQENTKFKLTLLLNYLLHDNYKVVVENVAKEFYPRGIRSVVAADLELVKRLKDRMPDLEIQGSCLSNRMTVEELEEERKEGVTLHNPSVNIIRDPAQLKRNAEAGYSSKVIAFEGCLNHCPDESTPYGHRWYLARSLTQESSFCTKKRIASDPRYFFKANWITVNRFKKLMPFIKVVKLPRCRSSISFALSTLIDSFNNNTSYNIVDFIGAGYQMYLARDVGNIPSHIFDDSFFDTLENCRMDCKERGCLLCFDKMRQIKRFSYKQKRLARRAQRKLPDRTWFVDKRWRNEKTIL